MQSLESRISLLDQAQIEGVDARLSGLVTKMDSIAEKVNGQSDPEKDAKVDCYLILVNLIIFMCYSNHNSINAKFVMLKYLCSTQVSELYELVKKTESVSSVLPQTVKRLTALESLHREGL